jgi:hypothetical protein
MGNIIICENNEEQLDIMELGLLSRYNNPIRNRNKYCDCGCEKYKNTPCFYNRRLFDTEFDLRPYVIEIYTQSEQ